mmetsp:Transcript_11509/g.35191  ORF Transcript_11509/g.35191 Transcript_11509/m.35191 type:complete len:201 (-) Transcript_11509:402-1004(-)
MRGGTEQGTESFFGLGIGRREDSAHAQVRRGDQRSESAVRLEEATALQVHRPKRCACLELEKVRECERVRGAEEVVCGDWSGPDDIARGSQQGSQRTLRRLCTGETNQSIVDRHTVISALKLQVFLKGKRRIRIKVRQEHRREQTRVHEDLGVVILETQLNLRGVLPMLLALLVWSQSGQFDEEVVRWIGDTAALTGHTG